MLIWLIIRNRSANYKIAVVAQLVERFHGKEKVSGSNPDDGSSLTSRHSGLFLIRVAMKIILLITMASWSILGHLATFHWTGLGLTRWAYLPDLLFLGLLTTFRYPFSRRKGWLILEQLIWAAVFYGSQIIKLRFWGWPLMPSEFSAIQSFWLILGDMGLIWQLALLLPVVLWLILIIFNWRWPKWKTYFSLILFIAAALALNHWPTKSLALLDKITTNSYWDQKTNYARRGPWLYLLQEGWRQKLAFQIPDQAAVEKARQIVGYSAQKITAKTKVDELPNIYFIVVESLWQPDLPDLKFSRSPWADNWQALAEQGLGQGLSPTFGGKTANAEFELLCGWPDVQPGIIFNGGITNQAPCLPQKLRESGYQTAAYHANVPAFWNRQQVYPLLGFDSFESLANYQQDDMNGEFMADSSFFAQTLKKIKAQDQTKPSFNYLLTYSSHLGYPLNASRPTVVTTTPAITDVATRYLNSLYYTTKELADFIKELQAFDPRAMIVVIGDHWPFLGDSDAGYREGGLWTKTPLTAEQIWQRSVTPLWSSYQGESWLYGQTVAFYQLPDALWQKIALPGQPFATWPASTTATWRPLDSLGEPSVIKKGKDDYSFCPQGESLTDCVETSQLTEATRTLILDIFRGHNYSAEKH